MNDYKNSIEQNLKYIKNKNTKIKTYKSVIKNILSFILPSIILLIIFNFILGIATIKGESMLYNFYNNDLVIYNRIINKVERNDIIVASKQNKTHIIKRVVGISGDTIDIIDNSVYLNGVKLDESRYISNSLTAIQDIKFPITLKNNEYFVLGDNRDKSLDSRNSKTGVINKKDVLGKVFFVFRLIK